MEIKTAESSGIRAAGDDIGEGGMQIKTASWDSGGGSTEDRLKKSLDAQTRMLYMELPRSAKKRVLKVYEREMEKAGVSVPESGTAQSSFSSFDGSQGENPSVLSGGAKGGSGYYSGFTEPSQRFHRGKVRTSAGEDTLESGKKRDSDDAERESVIIRTADAPISRQDIRTGKKAKKLGIDKSGGLEAYVYSADDSGNVPESGTQVSASSGAYNNPETGMEKSEATVSSIVPDFGTMELKDFTVPDEPELSTAAFGTVSSHGYASGPSPAGQVLNMAAPTAVNRSVGSERKPDPTERTSQAVPIKPASVSKAADTELPSKKAATAVQSEAVSGNAAGSRAAGAAALVRETVSKPVQSLGNAGRNAGSFQSGSDDGDEDQAGYVSDTISQGIDSNVSAFQGAADITQKTVNRVIERERNQTDIQKSRDIGRESFHVPKSGTRMPASGNSESSAAFQSEEVRSPSLTASQKAVRREASAKNPALVSGKGTGSASSPSGNVAGAVGNAGMQAAQSLGTAAQSAVPASSGGGNDSDERTDYASNSIGQGISTETGMLQGAAGMARDAYDYAKDQIRKESEGSNAPHLIPSYRESNVSPATSGGTMASVHEGSASVEQELRQTQGLSRVRELSQTQKPSVRAGNRIKFVTEQEGSFLEGRGELARNAREAARRQTEGTKDIQARQAPTGAVPAGYDGYATASGEPMAGSGQTAGQKAADTICSVSKDISPARMAESASMPGVGATGSAEGFVHSSESARFAANTAGPSAQAAGSAARTAGDAIKAASSSAKTAEATAKAAGSAAQAAETTAKAAGTAAKAAVKTTATAAEAGTAAATAGASVAAEAAVETAAMPVKVAEKVNAEIRRQYAAAELALEAGSRLGSDTAGNISSAGQGGGENKGGRRLIIGAIAAVFVTFFVLIIPVFITASAAATATYAAGAAYSEMEEYGKALAEAAWNEVSLGGFGGSTYLNWYNSYGHEITGNWCGVFISYCGYQCGYVGEGVSDSMPFLASCARMKEWYQHKGWYFDADGYIPSAGDIIFYTSGHAGIVYSYDESTLLVSTIEGNVDRADLPAGNGYLKTQSYRSIYSAEIEGYACPALSLLE